MVGVSEYFFPRFHLGWYLGARFQTGYFQLYTFINRCHTSQLKKSHTCFCNQHQRGSFNRLHEIAQLIYVCNSIMYCCCFLVCLILISRYLRRFRSIWGIFTTYFLSFMFKFSTSLEMYRVPLLSWPKETIDCLYMICKVPIALSIRLNMHENLRHSAVQR